MESGTSFNHAARLSHQVGGAAWGNALLLANDSRAALAKPHRGIGALAVSMRDLVRDTVYVTFDAIRGRYDR